LEYSSLCFKDKQHRKEERVRECIETVPERIELPEDVVATLASWRECRPKTRALLLDFGGQAPLRIENLLSLYYAVEKVDDKRALYEVFDSAICLLIYSLPT
jgi:hypothetical protein